MLQASSLKKLYLGAKEGLGLINGTQFICGLGAEAVVRAEMCCKIADIAGALSLEVLKGTPRAFLAKVHQTKPHAGQRTVAARLRRLLVPVDGTKEVPTPGERMKERDVEDGEPEARRAPRPFSPRDGIARDGRERDTSLLAGGGASQTTPTRTIGTAAGAGKRRCLAHHCGSGVTRRAVMNCVTQTVQAPDTHPRNAFRGFVSGVWTVCARRSEDLDGRRIWHTRLPIGAGLPRNTSSGLSLAYSVSPSERLGRPSDLYGTHNYEQSVQVG